MVPFHSFPPSESFDLAGFIDSLTVFTLSRGNFCTKKTAVVKNTGEEKIGKVSAFVVFDYVNCFAYPLFSRLWKEAVEKSVENVEKCEFSTGIPAFLTETAVVEKTV